MTMSSLPDPELVDIILGNPKSPAVGVLYQRYEVALKKRVFHGSRWNLPEVDRFNIYQTFFERLIRKGHLVKWNRNYSLWTFLHPRLDQVTAAYIRDVYMGKQNMFERSLRSSTLMQEFDSSAGDRDGDTWVCMTEGITRETPEDLLIAEQTLQFIADTYPEALSRHRMICH